MNIFYLDKDPRLAAQYHCDRHVVKMILESAQLLCTAINVHAGEQVTPYKSTHINHPCAVWVRESFDNWMYVYRLMLELEKEWQYRYCHTRLHKSATALLTCKDASAENYIVALALKHIGTAIGFTPPALCMPDDCKISPDTVECYRQYYRAHKTALHQWTRRERPEWL